MIDSVFWELKVEQIHAVYTRQQLETIPISKYYFKGTSNMNIYF